MNSEPASKNVELEDREEVFAQIDKIEKKYWKYMKKHSMKYYRLLSLL